MLSLPNNTPKNNALSHFSFDSGNLTNQAGLLLFKKLFKKLKLKELISKHLITDDKRSYSRNSDANIIIQLLFQIFY